MKRGYFKDSSPGLQFVFSLLLVLAAWLVFQLVALLTGALFFNIGLRDIQMVMSDLSNPVFISYQKYLQAVISMGMFILAPLAIAYSLSENSRRFLKLDYYPKHTVAFLVSLLMILSLPMNNYFTYLNNLLNLNDISPGIQQYIEEMEVKAGDLFERFLNVNGIWPLLLNIFVIAVIPAIGEELLFRGVLQKIFINWTKNVFLGVLITSIAFALLHFQFLSVLPRFVLGMVLGYMFVWTRSLWMPILAHFVNNALAVVYYYLMYNGYIGEGIEHVGKPDARPVYALLSTAIVLIILFVVRRMMRDKLSRSQHVKP